MTNSYHSFERKKTHFIPVARGSLLGSLPMTRVQLLLSCDVQDETQAWREPVEWQVGRHSQDSFFRRQSAESLHRAETISADN
jgi:hypothetical protein